MSHECDDDVVVTKFDFDAPYISYDEDPQDLEMSM